MKVNFEIKDGYAFTFKDRHIDIHNNFEFVSFEYKIELFELVLIWTKSNGDWVSKDELPLLTLVHKNVNYLNISPRDSEMPKSEDTCLDVMTYFPASYRDINDSSGDQRLPTEDDDIIYMFRGGKTIRVNCEEIELIA